MAQLLLGQTLSFASNPWHTPIAEAAIHERHGAVLVENGTIRAVGKADDLRAKHPDAKIINHGNHLIMAGFIDAHAHYSQTAIIASWGKRLIDWLNTYTFPEETRFADRTYADQVAETYLDLNLSNGITTACAYCTIHPESVDAYFEAAQKRGLRMLGGKVMMDRNAPDGLRDTAQSGYDDSKALLRKWHNTDRLSYVITPRFAPTSTEIQLEATGALWAEFPDCLMQTHLSEQSEEITWVRELFPDQQDYLAVYEHYGLTGPGAVLGHSIYLSDREWDAVKASGSSLAHCPTSNAFIGSGLFNAKRSHEMHIPTGLATDVGGGSSFSMLRTMASAYEIGQLRGDALHPAQLLWMATQGSADALRLGSKIGNLVAGREADIIVINLASTPVIEQRVARSENFWEQVFPTIMLGDDRAIDTVYINGQPIG
ncbi:MAG: guanine deaminase [Rhodobacteraceae bacterium]|nr:guanine deaminase [Paracoccaceae bacterium]